MLCEMHTHGSQVFLSILFWKITGKEEMATENMMQRTLYTVKMLAGQGRAGLVSTGVQCVDWSCYDGHRPDPIRWYHQQPGSQAPLPRTLQQLDQSPAAFGAEIMTHNLIPENGLMSWHEMRAVQDEQPGAWPGSMTTTVAVKSKQQGNRRNHPILVKSPLLQHTSGVCRKH